MDRREIAKRQREEGRALFLRLREERLASEARRQRRRQRRRQNILDEPIPEINVPILKPTPPVISKSKSLTKVSKPIQKEINNFAKWIESHVPPPIKKTANKRVERLKEKVNQIFQRQKRLQTKRTQKGSGRNNKNS